MESQTPPQHEWSSVVDTYQNQMTLSAHKGSSTLDTGQNQVAKIPQVAPCAHSPQRLTPIRTKWQKCPNDTLASKQSSMADRRRN